MPHESSTIALNNQPAHIRSSQRRWLFRAIAVCLGLSIFPLAELLCLAFDWGRPTAYDDPYVGFSKVSPLFVVDDSGAQYHIPPSRRRFFAAESFPIEKSPHTFRIFCIGESTVQGHPYSKETAFPTWLQLGLTAADPTRHWEVVNCGGVSYASYRLAPIVEECLRYQPDLFILAIGHNEFLEDRTYTGLKHDAFPGRAWLAHRRTFVLLSAGLQRLSGRDVRPLAERPLLAADANARLDRYDSLKNYHHDDAWHAGVLEHYEFNLRRMISLAREHRIPLIAVRQPSNLSDCEPFKSEHRVLHREADIAAFEQQLQRAKTLYRSDVSQAAALLENLAAPEDRYAAVYYELGNCYETLHRSAAARTAYLQARDFDACPLRMITPLEVRLATVCTKTGVPLLDAHKLLEERTPHRILGGPLLVDHVHPSFEGHQLIADALIDLMAQQGWAAPHSHWPEAAHAEYRRHFATLDDMYFLRGQRTLNSVRAWSQGRAGAPPMGELDATSP